jgi:hypothetical protein
MDRSPPLYALLPERYRKRDGDTQFTLKALTELLDGPRTQIEANIGALYRDWFVETCEDWVLPYLARLAGHYWVTHLAADRRALVADAIAFARRKGTYPALEHELAAITGWPVQIAFEAGAPVARYWDEPVYALREAAPQPDGDGRYRFHPMGLDCPLFAAPRAYPGIEAPFDPRLDAPVTLTMNADVALLERALAILIEDNKGELQPIPAADMAVADLGEWRAPTAVEARAFVDPVRGRFLLSEALARSGRIAVDFAYAAPGNVGGGPYERAMARPQKGTWVAYVHADARPDQGVPAYRTLADALEAFRSIPDHGLIRILDSSAYETGGLEIGAAPLVCATDPNAPRRLTIEALSGETPVLRGTLRFLGGATGLRLALNGLWIDGRIEIEGEVEACIEHCSVHPVTARGQARPGTGPILAIVATAGGAAPPALALNACLTGPLALSQGTVLTISDSAVDGYGADLAISGGPAATLVRCTLLGGADFAGLNARDTILDQPLTVPGGPPSAHHCFAPEGVALLNGAGNVGGVPPAYESRVFGMPGYARLDPAANEAIRTGASNGSEIGLFNSGHNAQRVELMTLRLKEVLPIGMVPKLERRPLMPQTDQGGTGTP